MYFDGALNLDGTGAGILFISHRGQQLKYVLQLLFKATNNAAEYKALIHGLRIAASLGIKRLLAYGDSMVVIQQVNKDWECFQEKMDAYCKEIRKLESYFYGLKFHHVLRGTTTWQLTYSPSWAPSGPSSLLESSYKLSILSQSRSKRSLQQNLI